jgi:3-methyladenine DNA glycosylase/8-oxoguanine DNA glycosylase
MLDICLEAGGAFIIAALDLHRNDVSAILEQKINLAAAVSVKARFYFSNKYSCEIHKISILTAKINGICR